MGPQGLVESLEGGSVGYVATPATHHQLEERRWAERRAVEEDLDGKCRGVKEIRWLRKVSGLRTLSKSF